MNSRILKRLQKEIGKSKLTRPDLGHREKKSTFVNHSDYKKTAKDEQDSKTHKSN